MKKTRFTFCGSCHRVSLPAHLPPLPLFLLVAGLTVEMSKASSNVFNFDSNPSATLTIRSSGENGTLASMAGVWFPTNGSTLETGVVDQSTNGYLAITQTSPFLASHGMGSTIVFADFDNGQVVGGFSFSCDVRIGAGSSTPADGFSISFAHTNDPAISSDIFLGGPNNDPPSGHEEGTTTGLVISLDAFSNSGSDLVGLTVKVDGTVLTNLSMATLNGACSNPTSLQTGTTTSNIVDLCWQPLHLSLGVNGLLSISYKNVTLLTNFPTQFTPSAGRFILAGRTGGLYEEQDMDNIRIVTFPPSTPVALYEPFDYTNVGGPVSTNTPSNWAYGGSGTNDLNVTGGNLAYLGLLPPVGNSVTNGGVGLGVRRLLGTALSGGTLYFSGLFRINELGYGSWNGATSQAGALIAADNASGRLQVMVKSNSPTGYVLGVQKGGSGATTTFGSGEYYSSATVFLVGKYDFTVSPNVVTLWLDPGASTLGTASSPTTGFVRATNGTDGFAIDRFNIQQDSVANVPATMQWDELRFGGTWADVTPKSTERVVSYAGNGNTGFGGAVGNGTLTLTDDGTTVYGTFTKVTGSYNDILVLFIDPGTGIGFQGTTNFTDSSDGANRAISGFDGVANRSTLGFPSGFRAAYAIAIRGYGGLYELHENAIHTLVGIVRPELADVEAATYRFSFDVSDIGLTPGSGATFKLLGTFVSVTGYRSTEAIAGSVSGVQGWNPFTAISNAVYTIRIVSPPISITRAGPSAASLSWPGSATLQTANAVTGPWNDLTHGTNSPYGIQFTNKMQFFRTRLGTNFSTNVVGYVTLTNSPGLSLISNPLNGPNNHLNTILPLPDTQDGVTIFKFYSEGQTYRDRLTFFGGFGWFSAEPAPDYLVNPGEGFWIQNIFTSNLVFTFVGEVPRGNLTNRIGNKYGLYSSIVPQSADLSSLDFPRRDNVLLYFFDAGTQRFSQALTFFDLPGQAAGWYNSEFNKVEPAPEVGQGFLLDNPHAAFDWTTSFGDTE